MAKFQPMKKILWSFWEIIETAVIAIVVVILIRTYLVQPFLVYGSSMSPNFESGDYLLVNELTYRFRPPERGEVIVFKSPTNPSTYFIKRIIGLPKEKIVIENGNVYVYQNDFDKGTLLHEPYLLGQKTNGHYEIVLKPNQYFVLGDNRGASFDSRSWGPLDSSNIVGWAMIRLWPLNKVAAFSLPHY